MIIEVTEIIEDIENGGGALVLSLKEENITVEGLQIPIGQGSIEKILLARDTVEKAKELQDDLRIRFFESMKRCTGFHL